MRIIEKGLIGMIGLKRTKKVSKKQEDKKKHHDDSSDSSEDEIVYLHQNIIINSDKQNSAQGSVFYVKL